MCELANQSRSYHAPAPAVLQVEKTQAGNHSPTGGAHRTGGREFGLVAPASLAVADEQARPWNVVGKMPMPAENVKLSFVRGTPVRTSETEALPGQVDMGFGVGQNTGEGGIACEQSVVGGVSTLGGSDFGLRDQRGMRTTETAESTERKRRKGSAKDAESAEGRWREQS